MRKERRWPWAMEKEKRLSEREYKKGTGEAGQ